jgi:hypothetical protein
LSQSRSLLLAIVLPVALLLLIQLVPYGRIHTNPPPGIQVAWDSPRTLELARRACFNCHSNETEWPWYSSIAPLSWRIQHHVTEGREKLNFTAFDAASKDMAEAAGEAAETVTKCEMPPQDYLLMHPEARLNAEEKRALVAGFEATFAAFAAGGEKGGKHGHDTGAGTSPGRERVDREHEKGGDRDGDRD